MHLWQKKNVDIYELILRVKNETIKDPMSTQLLLPTFVAYPDDKGEDQQNLCIIKIFTYLNNKPWIEAPIIKKFVKG